MIMPKKQKITYALSIEFPGEYAFTNFEDELATVFTGGSGSGFGGRDMSAYFKSEKARAKAIPKAQKILEKFNMTSKAVISTNEYNW